MTPAAPSRFDVLRELPLAALFAGIDHYAAAYDRGGRDVAPVLAAYLDEATRRLALARILEAGQ